MILWLMIDGLITYAMARHSKAAWVIGLIMASLSLVPGLELFAHLDEGWDQEAFWFLSGLVVGSLSLVTLLSRQALAWMKKPTVRRWDP